MRAFFEKHGSTILVSMLTSLSVVLVVIGVLALGINLKGRVVFEYIASEYLLDTAERDSRNPLLAPGDAAVVQAVERATPAVVSVVVTKDVPVIERYYERYSPFDDFFGFDPFGAFLIPREREQGTERREVGGGSGFIVSPDGLIITNKHVVSDETADYSVLLNDGSTHEVTVLAQDPVFDIAVLKLEGVTDLPHLEFGESSNLQLGQTVIAIGNALGEFRNSVSVGVVSGLARSIVARGAFGSPEILDEVIQTDAAINPGNSGGPLLDVLGRVVGVNVAVARGSENIGFALPSDVVRGVVASVEETGTIVRPYLGVRYLTITKAVAEQNSLPVDHGVLVTGGEEANEQAVVPNSPADKAGIVEGDIILSVDGTRLTPEISLASLIRRKSVGETVALTILRDGEEQHVPVLLEQAPETL